MKNRTFPFFFLKGNKKEKVEAVLNYENEVIEKEKQKKKSMRVFVYIATRRYTF